MTNKSIGQFIAALRKANGMTQQEVADRLNVSNKAVSRWERDECSPDILLIPALAEMFGVTCDELLKGERIFDSPQPEKKEPKVEKQLKAIINRAISGFKIMIWISLALSAVGLICMFGISYGFYRPAIGFTVMLLFEVAAVVIGAIATNQLKAKMDNDLFENADKSLSDKVNKNLGLFSFTAFFTALSVILLSIPLTINNSQYIESVITFKSYALNFLWIIALVLVLVYFIAKNRYIAWITDQPYIDSAQTIDPRVKQMTLLQLGAAILSGIAFFALPFLDTEPNYTSPIFWVVIIFGLIMFLANTICFLFFMIKYKNHNRHLILPGIRNILLYGSVRIISGAYQVGFFRNTDTSGITSSWERYDIWNYEFFIYSIVYAFVIIAIFKIIDILIAKRTLK